MPTRGMNSSNLVLTVRFLVCRLPVSLIPLTFESITHLVLEGKWFFAHSRDGETKPTLMHCVVDANLKGNPRFKHSSGYNGAQVTNMNYEKLAPKVF